LRRRIRLPNSLPANQPEILMAKPLPRFKKTALFLGATALLALSQAALTAPADAAPLAVSKPATADRIALPIGYYGRRGPPVLPYYYAPGRPGGWSFYSGFVPYARGNYEVQALQRLYPQTNWPPSMRYWTPQSQF
jgi:hypothetical protein